MIKIRANFIQSSDGTWHNLNMVKSLYVGGDDEVGYRICVSFEYPDGKTRPMSFWSIGETRKTKEEAQTQLDAVLDAIDYVAD